MTTTPDDCAHSWRDIADQLTPEQVAELDHWEQRPEPHQTDDHLREALLRAARDYAGRNIVDIRYSDVPAPPDATDTGAWDKGEGGIYARFIRGTHRQVRHLTVTIGGLQYSNGVIERTIRVQPGETDDGEMTADLAREVAAALTAAADEIDAAAANTQPG